MPLGKNKIKWLTGSFLSLLVLVTRLPFISKTLFEFDSIDFAVATFRFSLEQVTPHFPGYILHILFARFLLLFFSDINLAFVGISILLSIGSVLFMWRSAALLRGERVGFVAATFWAFNPMFWFYGEVATVYIYEAFFACALMYYGIKILRDKENRAALLFLVIFFSLSIGVRQSSALFFAPAIFYLFWKTKQPLKSWLYAAIVFIAVTAIWVLILLHESGGLAAYLAAAGRESIYRSQSVLFGNPLSEHLAVIGKVGFYLMVGSIPVLFVFLFSVMRFPKDTLQFIKDQIRKPAFKYCFLIALFPMLFYLGVFFMKAGYLLNVLPFISLGGAVLLDMCVIWLARSQKIKAQSPLLLTRPIITKYTAILLSVVSVFNILWFILPIKGKEFAIFADLFNRHTFQPTLGSHYSQEQNKASFFLNKCFAYTSSAGVAAADSINTAVINMLKREIPEPANAVIIDTWWQRQAYYYDPLPVTYSIQSKLEDTIQIKAKQSNFVSSAVDSVVLIPSTIKDVLIFIRKQHPDLAMISKQVHLQKVEMPEFLDVYRISDEHFLLQWKNLRFVK